MARLGPAGVSSRQASRRTAACVCENSPAIHGWVIRYPNPVSPGGTKERLTCPHRGRGRAVALRGLVRDSNHPLRARRQIGKGGLGNKAARNAALPVCTAPAKRSGDGAFARTRRVGTRPHTALPRLSPPRPRAPFRHGPGGTPQEISRGPASVSERSPRSTPRKTPLPRRGIGEKTPAHPATLFLRCPAGASPHTRSNRGPRSLPLACPRLIFSDAAPRPRPTPAPLALSVIAPTPPTPSRRIISFVLPGLYLSSTRVTQR